MSIVKPLSAIQHLTPQWGPVLVRLLAHEGTNIFRLAESKSCHPQQHIHGVKMEVAVRDDKAGDVVFNRSHVEGLAGDFNVEALLGALVPCLLVNGVDESNEFLEEVDDVVEGLEGRGV